MTLKELRQIVKQDDAFKHVRLSILGRGSNVVVVTGDLVGTSMKDQLNALCAKHGFIALSDSLSIWFSEDDFLKYGPNTQKSSF